MKGHWRGNSVKNNEATFEGTVVKGKRLDFELKFRNRIDRRSNVNKRDWTTYIKEINCRRGKRRTSDSKITIV